MVVSPSPFFLSNMSAIVAKRLLTSAGIHSDYKTDFLDPNWPFHERMRCFAQPSNPVEICLDHETCEYVYSHDGMEERASSPYGILIALVTLGVLRDKAAATAWNGVYLTVDNGETYVKGFDLRHLPFGEFYRAHGIYNERSLCTKSNIDKKYLFIGPKASRLRPSMSDFLAGAEPAGVANGAGAQAAHVAVAVASPIALPRPKRLRDYLKSGAVISYETIHGIYDRDDDKIVRAGVTYYSLKEFSATLGKPTDKWEKFQTRDRDGKQCLLSSLPIA